jgi:predicted transcriptional regulator
MCHTIGFSRREIKYNKYSAYRNRFVVNANSDDCVNLVALETTGLVERKAYQDSYCFSVTGEGFKLLEAIFDCKMEVVG